MSGSCCFEGFVRFVAEQDAVGASELEAAAEEEGTDVIRLLTIHSAKGLEFKVVVVADAGRDRGRQDADEILCLPDGRLGFRVADPASGQRLSTPEYEKVKEAERDAEEAERRRLYYVAMTRARNELHLCAPLKFQVTQQPKTGDKHVYGAKSRFMTDKVVDTCEKVTIRNTVNVDSLKDNEEATIDATARLKEMW